MKTQRGMTLIGMLLTVASVVLAGILVIQIIPVYLQYYSITQSIQSLRTIPPNDLSGDPVMDIQLLRTSLDKRLDLNGINYIKEDNVKITPNGFKKFQVNLKYQVVTPLMYHANLMFDFNENYEVQFASDQ